LGGKYFIIRLVLAHENIEITRGDDVDNDIIIEPCPTHHEVLKAVLTIGMCMKDSNDPNACKLEALLGLLGKQLCIDKAQSTALF